jgi:hypothetical protein
LRYFIPDISNQKPPCEALLFGLQFYIPATREKVMAVRQYRHYVVLLEHFTMDEDNNPLAYYTIFGTDGPVDNSGPTFAAPTLFRSKKRQKTGFIPHSDVYVSTALHKIGAPNACTLMKREGSIIKDEIWLVYNSPILQQGEII